MRAALFPRTWTRSRILSRQSGSEHRPRKQVSLSAALAPASANSPLPAVAPRTGERDPLVMTRPTDDGVALPRCLWQLRGWWHARVPTERKFFLSLPLSLSSPVSRWPPLLASHAELSRGEPPRNPKRRDEEKDRDEIRCDLLAWRLAARWHLNGQLTCPRRSTANVLPLCPGLVASRLPRLPSSTWNPSAWRWSFAEYNASYIGCPSLKHRLPPSSTIPFKPTRPPLSFSLSRFYEDTPLS